MRYALFMMAGLLMLALTLPVPARAQYPYPNGAYGQPQGWHGVLSAQDQQDFDKAYSDWVNATRSGDKDDISKNAQRMQSIMARYTIPPTVSFDQVATYPAGYAYPNGQYPAAYPPPYPAYTGRLTADDQKKFDKEYSKWADGQRRGDAEDTNEHAMNMQKIMSRYSIPENVPFAAVATNGYAVAPYPYPANPNYPAAYPYPYAYGQRAALSEHDQKDFNKAYKNWVEARDRKDMDDVDKNARKMEDIMARYNIPANVSFSSVATQVPVY